uniref:MFS domain-containing protein n=1 Tax=Rhabditophanes sp. KR3021 TaxID=114890 RepID=A0AC35UF90_9BILA
MPSIIKMDTLVSKTDDAEATEKIVSVPVPEKKMVIEDFFKLGWYTAIICAMYQFFILSQLGNMVFMTFGGLVPKIESCGHQNFTTLGWDQKQVCAYLKNNTDCVPVAKGAFESVNIEWNYLCEDRLKIKTSISVQMIGVIFGSIVGGQLSDLYGRRKILLWAIIFCAAFVVASSFSTEIISLTATRTFVGFFNGMTISIIAVFIIENVPKNDRVWINNVITWSPNTIIFAIVAYFAHEWRILARSTAALTIPAILLCYFVCESVRWLVQKGRIQDAQDAVKKIFGINRRTYNEQEVKELLEAEFSKNSSSAGSAAKKYSFYHLYSTWTFASYSATLHITFFIASLAQYGILFNLEKLSGSVYTNMILMGSLRYLMNIAIAILDPRIPKLGRRTILIMFVLAITASCGFISFVLIFNLKEEFGLVVRILQISCVALTSQLYIIGGICSSELFPTPVRNLSYSALQFFSRIGVVLAPYLFYLGSFHDSAPYLTLAVITLVTAASFYKFIPETKGKPLNEQMPSEEDYIFGAKKAGGLTDSDVTEKMVAKE